MGHVAAEFIRCFELDTNSFVLPPPYVRLRRLILMLPVSTHDSARLVASCNTGTMELIIT
jgi:hypothetical protein